MPSKGYAELPQELMDLIFAGLDARDMVCCMAVCTSWRAAARSTREWKRLCLVDFDVEEGDMEMYKQWHAQVGHLLPAYGRVARAWRRIRQFGAARGLGRSISLVAGVDDREFDVLRTCGLKDVRASYRIVGGQDTSRDVAGPFFQSIFGTCLFYDEVEADRLLRPAEISQPDGLPYLTLCGTMYGDQDDSIVVLTREVRDDRRTYAAGTVLARLVGRYLFRAVVLAPSWADFLEDHADCLWRGYRAVRPWHLASFPARHTDQCTSQLNTRGRTPLITRNRRDATWGSVTETHGIRVEVAVDIARGQSFDKICYTYRITLSMRPDAPASMSCQLLRRHWRIHDAGRTTEIAGDGVVGMYPACAPGAPAFTYASCTTMGETGGWMEGEFEMQLIPRQVAEEIAENNGRQFEPFPVARPTEITINVARFVFPPAQVLTL